MAEPPTISAEVAGPVRYAGVWPRLAASLIDWALCFIAPSVVSSFVITGISGEDGEAQAAVGVLWGLFMIACVLGYLTYFWARGQSLGMKALGLRIVDVETSGPPGAARALARSFLGLLAAAAVFILLVVSFSDRPKGFSGTDLAVTYLLLFVLMASLVGWVWAIWDRQRRSLQDRLCGVAVIAAAPKQ
ncbi:MAG: RDD family protein [Chloroflexi bacterium]|nr:RDD family protein [Chloroflexota bacterium]